MLGRRKSPPRRAQQGSPRRRSEEKFSHWAHGTAPLPVPSQKAGVLAEPSPFGLSMTLADVVKIAQDKANECDGKLPEEPEPPPDDEAPGANSRMDGPSEDFPDAPPASKKPAVPNMKGVTIKSWLNHTLGQATQKSESAPAARTLKPAQGMSEFGIDTAALAKLGIDQKAQERVYRAMFVYSQGLHAVLQEASSRARNANEALLILWRAFQAVLEQAGHAAEEGPESIGAIVQQGQEEDKERVERECQEQITAMHEQVHRAKLDLRESRDELQRVSEDQMRLRHERTRYIADYESTKQKYDEEVAKRTEVEAKYQERTKECETLQANLTKRTNETTELRNRWNEELAAKSKAKQEIDILKNQNKVCEAQLQFLRAQPQEASMHKQRLEQQVETLKQQLEQHLGKSVELQGQLDIEQEANKKLTEQVSTEQRSSRRNERELEDQQHMRQEVENERNLLREKLGRLEKHELTLIEERRNLQKQLNDLNLVHRTVQIELNRKVDQVERAETSLKTLQVSHQELQDIHRTMGVELDNLREDVLRLDDQLTKETGLRKSLQEEKKTLMAQVQNLVVQLETSRLAVDSTQRELTDVTNNKVRLESILRDTKSAMQKMTLEQQVEQKSHAQRVAMLEKVMSDERAERRNLVSETMEVSASREETLDTLRKANQEITEIKRQRFEKEEEIERLKVLLQAQEQRNAEQLVTVDKYHAVVASHESEMRQIQMLLECEREEAARKMAELQDTYTAAKKSMEQRLEQYSHCCEDLRSHICLREDEKTKEAEKMKRAHLEEQVKGLKARMDVVQESADQNEERAKRAEAEVQKRDARILSLQQSVAVAEEKRDMWKARLDAVLPDVEHASLAREDAQMQYERIRVSTEVFQEVKASLERQLAQAKMEIQRLVASLTRQTAEVGTQVVLNLSDTAQQTDLSYQYLEQADHMQNDRWRRDRLDSLKRASSFVEDVEEKRDFTVIMRRTAPPVAQLGPEAAQQEPFGTLRSGNNPSGPVPWSTIAPPTAAPSVGSQKVQAMRRSFPVSGGGLYVAQVKTQGRTQ